MKKILLMIILLFAFPPAFAEDNIIINVGRDVSPETPAILNSQPQIKASHYRLVEIDVKQLRAKLAKAMFQDKQAKKSAVWLSLPAPDGNRVSYVISNNSTMSPGLAAKFPEIKSYNGYGKAGELVKLDLTPKGFHAMIMAPGKPVIFIDPYLKKDDRYYIVYKVKDFITNKKMFCRVKTPASISGIPHQSTFSTPYTNCALKQYRLALAATYEYTQFTGGSIDTAMAAEVTTINRVNGVYETDAGVTLQLITNNDAVICDYAGCPTSPPAPAGVESYTSGNTTALLNQNQVNLDLIIGSSNYDIGHVVDAVADADAAGGVAALAVVCNISEKARGVTGSLNPVGDPFDIDYVAHEIGHQFGGTHTQNNNCNRDTTTSVEPGSGSTIIAYPGICAPNVQNNSDPYFNGITLEQMGSFTQSTATCSTNTTIPDAPVITGSNANSTVPVSTPFALNVTATGAAGATLTYTWEQMNPEVTTQPPVSTATSGPSFRSFEPTTDETRYFPNLQALANDGPFTWEVLPSVARTMNFRVSVRNNTANGSCNAYQDYTVTTDSTSGPFEVTYPNESNIFWTSGSQQTITWNVANTTNGAVNAANVNILLSTDGGLTYPNVIATAVPNNGSYTFTAPNIETSEGRIMVSSSTNTFFNISSNNFAINSGTPTLTQAVRNPLNKTSAFIYFSNIPDDWFSGSFTLNGFAGAGLNIDSANRRFIVSNVTTPQAVDVSITILINGVEIATNTITIPSILGKK